MSLNWPEDPADASKSTVKPTQVKIVVALCAVGAAIAALMTYLFVQVYSQYTSTNPPKELNEAVRDVLKREEVPVTDANIQQRLDEAAGNLLIVLIVFAISVVLWIAMALLVNRGYGFTRWAATVLGGLNLLFILTSPALLEIRTLASVLIGIAAAGLLWTGSARSWLSKSVNGPWRQR